MARSDATPLQMWAYANDYRKAATFVLAQYPDQPFMPYYSLLGHAIELVLKAYLLAHGVPLTELRSPKKYGHNLKALVRAAFDRGIDSIVPLSRAHWAAIDLFSDDYRSKRFHYVSPGSVLIPDLRLGHEAAEALCEYLKDHCTVQSGA